MLIWDGVAINYKFKQTAKLIEVISKYHNTLDASKRW